MIKLLLTAFLLGGIAFAQAEGYYVLDVEPTQAKKNKIATLTVWEFDVDEQGEPIGQGVKYHRFGYDEGGFRNEITRYDTLGQLYSKTNFYGRKGESLGLGEFWERSVTTDHAGKVLAIDSGRVNGDGDSVWVYDYHRFFKPCYCDYFYQFDALGLKKNALMVLPKYGLIYSMRKEVVPVKWYWFEYEYLD